MSEDNAEDLATRLLGSQKVRLECFNEGDRYRVSIQKLEKGLDTIRRGKFPRSFSDTHVPRFADSVEELYGVARRISESYPDPDNKRKRELDELGKQVKEACERLR